MRDEAWVDGMRDLAVAFPTQDQDPNVLRARGAVYLRELGNLTDEAWLYAVREAIRNERWFPTVNVLLDYAARAPQPPSRTVLPDDTRTSEERRADAKRLLEQLRQAIGQDGADSEPTNGLTRAIPPKPVVATEERMTELRRQAAAIQQPATAEAVDEGRP
jgi:hypothetical protein